MTYDENAHENARISDFEMMLDSVRDALPHEQLNDAARAFEPVQAFYRNPRNRDTPFRLGALGTSWHFENAEDAAFFLAKLRRERCVFNCNKINGTTR